MTADRPYVAAGAIVIHDGSLLLVRRGREPGKGLWSLPGGRVEGGEYMSDAVRREVKEETGLDVEVGDLVGILEVPGDPHYVIHDYAARVVGDPTPVASGDVDDARWVALEEVAGYDLTPRILESMRAWGVLAEG